MSRYFLTVVVCIGLVTPAMVRADIVTDWNATMRNAIQHDGMHAVHSANPGWSTRSIAMVNGAIYDAFQSINRTHAPMVYTAKTSNASLDAAVNQAARDLLIDCYTHGDEQLIVQNAYDARMALIPASAQKTNGMALGSAIAQAYMAHRTGDGANQGATYAPQAGPGKWRPDPFHPDQVAWGPGWGAVNEWMIGDTTPFVNALPALPALDSQAYADAYNQVLNYGALNTYGPANTLTSRTADQTAVGLFWAYDRPSMGPPPVLFVKSLEEIAEEVGNTPAENARVFAMASVAQADAATAAWDAKFKYNFWRPVGAIQEGDTDNNPNTIQDADWRPLGAPGGNPDDMTDDFTPPFPAWTSGHATMGAAWYKAVELFYGTNHFSTADASRGADPVTGNYVLTSQEAGSGTARTFTNFTHTGVLDVNSFAGSPDGENAISRIFLGIHWIMDQRDGQTLGYSIANYVAANHFQAVPEPGTFVLTLLGAAAMALQMRRKRSC